MILKERGKKLNVVSQSDCIFYGGGDNDEIFLKVFFCSAQQKKTSKPARHNPKPPNERKTHEDHDAQVKQAHFYIFLMNLSGW